MQSRTRRILRGICVTGVALVAVLPLLAGSTTTTATATSTAGVMALRSVEHEGRCRSGPGEWELRVHARAGRRLRVEFRVDKIAPRQRWNMFMAANGHRLASVTRRSGTSGHVKVIRFTRNRQGRDRIRAAAVNPRTGSTCVGRLRF